jgi:hypothetical protein
MPVSFKNAVKKLIHAHVVDEAPANERQELDVRIKATEIECVPIGQLKPNPRNAKKHPSRQIALLVENYEQFGVTQPIVVDEDGTIICGHARFEAAQKAKLNHLPVVRLSDLRGRKNIQQSWRPRSDRPWPGHFRSQGREALQPQRYQRLQTLW